jgi:choline dehydrogenase-like flavoprotein
VIASIANTLLWVYFILSRPFLRRFSASVLGETYALPALRPNGSSIVDVVERVMRTVNRATFHNFAGAIMTLPLIPPRYPLPRSYFGRALAKLWAGLKSHVARAKFTWWSSPQERAARIDQMYEELIQLAPEQEDDAVKTIVSLSALRGLMAAAYLDDPELWRAVGFSPVPQPKGIVPPTGPDFVKPPRSENAELLHRHVTSAAAAAARRPTYCVMGSGAGGAISALTLKELDPDARVILLESGPLVTHDEFSPHTLDATARLYMNGSVTLSQDQQFTFRQGRAVGGSTVVNNSVCIKPTGVWWDKYIVERWHQKGIYLDWDSLHETYDDIATLVNARPIDPRVLTPAARTVREGFECLRSAQVTAIGLAPVNTVGCIGCSRCNVGCQYEAKQSMLTSVLPRFVHAGGEIVANASVDSLVFRNGRVTGARISDASGQKYVIEADKFVLATGAYASTKVLWRSGYLGAINGLRTVGKQFSVNLGSPVTGVFPEPQYGMRGQQVGYVMEVPNERMIIETAFAQPAVVGLMAPQWGQAFQQKVVQRIDHLATAVPVLASSTYGHIKRGMLGSSGFVIDYTVSDDDWLRLQRGMRLVAQAMFARGATEIFINRFDAATLTSSDDRELDEYFSGLGAGNFVHVESAHMQGGNVLAGKPGRGVVDRTMRLFDVENLWICDASVIPAPITVNIAMTVMALSRYAAPYVVGAATDREARAMRARIACH